MENKHNCKPFDDRKICISSSSSVIMPPTLKKLMGHIAFGACMRAWVLGASHFLARLYKVQVELL